MLKEILQKCHGLPVCDERCSEDDYAERVIYQKDLSLWNDALTGIFGPAVKPAGAAPTAEDQAVAKEYGGIYEGQTLFKGEFDGGNSVIAMIWPWQDNERATLKIVCITD